MRYRFSIWLLFGLLLTWALPHASVFGQQDGKTDAAKIRQCLDKTITLDYNGQNLSEVLGHIRDKTGLPISIDSAAFMQMGLIADDAIGQVKIKAKNEKVSHVLRRLLNAHSMTYIVLEDGLFVTSPETGIYQQMRLRVSIDVEGVPLKKAARELARMHGINLVIDPKVSKQGETPVSLQLENAGLETTIRLLAELANLKAVRMGNVMFITSEEKAAKIRDEEKHQMDNPLNPNVPGPGPFPAFNGMMGGGIGGGFGGGIKVQVGVPPGAVPPPAAVDLPPAKEKAETPDEKKPSPSVPRQTNQSRDRQGALETKRSFSAP